MWHRNINGCFCSIGNNYLRVCGNECDRNSHGLQLVALLTVPPRFIQIHIPLDIKFAFFFLATTASSEHTASKSNGKDEELSGLGQPQAY